MTLTDTMIRLSQLTAGEWLWKIFKEDYEPIEIQSGPHKGEMTCLPHSQQTRLEGLGDLEELDDLITKHCIFISDPNNRYSFEAPLAKLHNMWNFINAAQHICTPEDLTEHIPTCYEFEQEYPYLMQLFITWAWG